MKILYLDLGMGAAGDMLAGALLALLPASGRAEFLERFNALGLPGVAARTEPAAQHGVTGLRFRVGVHGEEEHEGGPHHHHVHRGLEEIGALVDGLALAPDEKAEVLAVYDAIAEAEGAVHGVPVTEVHFHELGALDALADITATALLLRALAPDRVVCSPVAVGSGTVRCAHGVLPVPAPATALLLRGVACYAGDVKGELCTPTGAALVKRFASEFGAMPPMTPEAVGCGFGTKEFSDKPNCVRAIFGEAVEAETPHQSASPQGEATGERIVEFQCNIDDMTPEAVGFALERLYAAGAVEAFWTAVGMKKNRPGVLLTAICPPAARGAVLEALFAHTTTLGVRENAPARHVLSRRIETAETVFGPVRRKIAAGYGVEKAKWEYDDLAAIAAGEDMTLEDVRRIIDSDDAE